MFEFRLFRLPIGPGVEQVSQMQQRRTPAAGGIFLFLGPILGALYGIGRGELVPWMFYGFGIGIALALIVWLVDRRKRRP